MSSSPTTQIPIERLSIAGAGGAGRRHAQTEEFPVQRVSNVQVVNDTGERIECSLLLVCMDAGRVTREYVFQLGAAETGDYQIPDRSIDASMLYVSGGEVEIVRGYENDTEVYFVHKKRR
jgi:hypothetical protein